MRTVWIWKGPTGTVTFRDGVTSLGTVTLSSGTANFTTSALANGSHSVTAAYSGGANFAASTSAATTIVVSAPKTPPAKTPTIVSVQPNATQLTSGQSLALGISVTRQGGTGTPTGTLTILDGHTQLAALNLVAGAASFSTSTLASGSHSITANYSGDSNFLASSSAVVLVTVSAVAKISTTTSLSLSASQIAAGADVTIMAKVSPASGAAAPTARFPSSIPTRR